MPDCRTVLARLGLLLSVAGPLSGCAPALDWREVRVGETALRAVLPCKPSVEQRVVPLAGRRVALTLQACAAGGQTWGLASADLQDPALIGASLNELAALAAGNIRASGSRDAPFLPPGATPNPASRKLLLDGRTPEDKPVAMQVAVFSHGTVAFQATVLGASIPPEAAAAFFDDLRVSP
jgi:hypothetical protein